MTALFELTVAPAEYEIMAVLTSHLGKEMADTFADRLAAVSDLVTPLTRVSSSATLEELLAGTMPRYLQAFNEAYAPLEAIPMHVVLAMQREIAYILHPSLEARAREKVHILGDDGLAQFLGGLASFGAFNQFMIEATEKEGLAAYHLNAMHALAEGSFLKAVICLTAIGAVLVEAVKDWTPEAPALLANLLDAYMTEVEDAYLTVTVAKELDRSRLVDYADVKRVLGL